MTPLKDELKRTVYRPCSDRYLNNTEIFVGGTTVRWTGTRTSRRSLFMSDAPVDFISDTRMESAHEILCITEKGR